MDQRLGFFTPIPSITFAPEMSCFDPALISMQNQIDNTPSSLLYTTNQQLCFDNNSSLPFPYMDHATLEALFNDTQFKTLPQKAPRSRRHSIAHDNNRNMNNIFSSNPASLSWGVYNPGSANLFTTLQFVNTPQASSKSKTKRRSSTSNMSSLNSNVIHTCPYPTCMRAFKRPEHLKRHINSLHSSEKPYQCNQPNCARRFSRSDNLNQHLKVHQDKSTITNTAGVTAPAPRKHSAAF